MDLRINKKLHEKGINHFLKTIKLERNNYEYSELEMILK